MTLVLTDEHAALRDTVRQLFTDRATETQLRKLIDTELGYDPSVWKQLAELGLLGLSVDEKYGGSGASFVELGLVIEEAGRVLLSAPLVSTAVLAASALLGCGDEAAKLEYLPELAAGRLTVALAFDDEVDADNVAVAARQVASGWRLTGKAARVIDGKTADLLLVVADTGTGPGLFAVPGSADGVTRTALTTLDATRRQARLDLADAPGRRIDQGVDVARLIEEVRLRGAVAIAMEQVGGMQRVLDMAVEYAGMRVQFGRVIGSFQAVKHRCADMLIRLELARSAAYQALWAVVHDPGSLPAAAALAKSYCSDAYFELAWNNIMVHGGIGFTWEHSAHLFFRRAKSDQLLLGTPSAQRESMLRAVGV